MFQILWTIENILAAWNANLITRDEARNLLDERQGLRNAEQLEVMRNIIEKGRLEKGDKKEFNLK